MAVYLAAVGIVSYIAYATDNSGFWLVAAGMAAFTGFYWFDTYETAQGLAFGLLFLGYSLVCFSIAFISLFTSIKARLRKILNIEGGY